MATIDEVIQAAMTLNNDERMHVAELLWDSLPVESPLEWDEAARKELEEELHAAMEDHRAGRDPGRPWQEVKAELLRDIDDIHDDAL